MFVMVYICNNCVTVTIHVFMYPLTVRVTLFEQKRNDIDTIYKRKDVYAF